MVIVRCDVLNWFSAEGVARKRRAIERKGVPNMRNWRLTTVTIDPEVCGYDPRLGYEMGKEKLRRFMERMRKFMGKEFDWAWKFEFSDEGWPHWHIPWSHKRKLGLLQMEVISGIWGLGRVNHKRIRDKSLSYLWKYVTKTSSKTGGGYGAPDWFLDYEEKTESGRVLTYERARFWQTSRGFYTGEIEEIPPARPPRSCAVKWTVRRAIDDAKRKVRVLAIGAQGEIVKSATVRLKRTWKVALDTLGKLSLTGRAAGLGVGKYTSSDRVIQNLISKIWLSKIDQLQKLNRLGSEWMIRQAWHRTGVTIPF